MDWLKNAIKNNPFVSLILPMGLGAGSFFVNLLQALMDFNIDSAELQQLLASANALQTVLLIIIMFALKEFKPPKHG